MNLEKSETDKRDQIKSLKEWNLSNVQEPSEDDYLEDIDTDLEHDPKIIEKDSEEWETDEGDQIENQKISNMIKIWEPREDDNLVDTDTESEDGPVHDTKKVENKINKNLTNLVIGNRQD